MSLRLYYVTGASQVPAAYRGTQAEAAALAADLAKRYPFDRGDIRVELVDVATYKEAILAMLNGEGGFQNGVARTWRLGPRGGLVECPNGE